MKTLLDSKAHKVPQSAFCTLCSGGVDDPELRPQAWSALVGLCDLRSAPNQWASEVAQSRTSYYELASAVLDMCEEPQASSSKQKQPVYSKRDQDLIEYVFSVAIYTSIDRCTAQRTTHIAHVRA